MQKAISAIIATIMLLMISVSLISVFYVFSSTLASTTTSSGSAQVSQLTSQLSMCMQVDNIYKNQVTLRNCGKGVIENKSLVVTMDDVKLGASTNTIQEGNSSVVNITGLWQISPGTHSLKISSGAAVAQNLVDVQPNKDGLVGSWNFDEGSGTMAGDGSGNNNIGTLLPAGSEPTWVSGKSGKGLQFDGSNDYVDAGNSASLNYINGYTINVWVKPNSIGSTQGIVSKSSGGDGSTEAVGLWLWPSNTFALFIGNGAGSTDYIQSNVITNGNWYNIIGVVTSNSLTIYTNGISNAKSTTITPRIDTLNYLIGTTNTHFFSGTIDEVRIWNKALAPDETVVMKQII